MPRRGAAAHMHRNAETSKPKGSKPAHQDLSSQAHSNSQPTTSRAVKKPPAAGEGEGAAEDLNDNSGPRDAAVLGSPRISSVDKLGKKKWQIPKIIVTGPSDEVLISSVTDVLPETRTIRDTEDYGMYSVHSKPSTVDAYKTAKDQ